MKIEKNQIDEYINLLTENPNYVDNLPEDVVDMLIDYLQEEIQSKEQQISELQESSAN